MWRSMVATVAPMRIEPTPFPARIARRGPDGSAQFRGGGTGKRADVALGGLGGDGFAAWVFAAAAFCLGSERQPSVAAASAKNGTRRGMTLGLRICPPKRGGTC